MPKSHQKRRSQSLSEICVTLANVASLHTLSDAKRNKLLRAFLPMGEWNDGDEVEANENLVEAFDAVHAYLVPLVDGKDVVLPGTVSWWLRDGHLRAKPESTAFRTTDFPLAEAIVEEFFKKGRCPLRRCPECHTIFFRQRERVYCSVACRSKVAARQPRDRYMQKQMKNRRRLMDQLKKIAQQQGTKAGSAAFPAPDDQAAWEQCFQELRGWAMSNKRPLPKKWGWEQARNIALTGKVNG